MYSSSEICITMSNLHTIGCTLRDMNILKLYKKKKNQKLRLEFLPIGIRGCKII